MTGIIAQGWGIMVPHGVEEFRRALIPPWAFMEDGPHEAFRWMRFLQSTTRGR